MQTLSCHCRHCGCVISYSADDIGADARCARCGETIRLPGRLTSVATIQTERRKDLMGLAMEGLGFLAMFFFFPWGLLAGAALVFFGWRKSHAYVCTKCGARLKSKTVETCPGCRSKFGRE